MEAKDLYFLNYEFSLQLDRTGTLELNGKTIYKKYKIPKIEINKIFENKYKFGFTNKTDLYYLDFLVEEFKYKIAEFVEDAYIKEQINSLLFIKRQNKFEEWLKNVEITIKDL